MADKEIRPMIIVFVKGGMVREILSDSDIDALVIDYDVDGSDDPSYHDPKYGWYQVRTPPSHIDPDRVVLALHAIKL